MYRVIYDRFGKRLVMIFNSIQDAEELAAKYNGCVQQRCEKREQVHTKTGDKIVKITTWE
jgi:hypothetical protein